MGSFFVQVTLAPRWWRILFWVNLLGSLYGFWWYRWQLISTPVWQWLIVPDSPGSTLLFSFFLWYLLSTGDRWARRDGPVRLQGWPGWLGAFAFLANMKYGLWTAIVLPQAGIVSGEWAFDHVHLSLSHFGMWLQGILFLRRYRPGVWPALAAWTGMYFQDYVDYWLLGTHPTLPVPELAPSVRLIALALSTIWGIVLLRQALDREPETPLSS